MVVPAVGLIMGTRLWYAMWDANEDDDAAFERRAYPVLREIGGRCKVVVAGAGQQTHEPTPAPSPGPTRQVAQPQTPGMGAPHGSTSSSHSNQQQENKAEVGPPAVATVQRMPSTASSSTSGGFAEMAAFIREERTFISEERTQIEAKLETQRQEWEARLEAQRQEWESQRKEFETKLETQRKECEAKLETQRKESEAKLETQRQEWEVKLDTQRQANESQLHEREAKLETAWKSKLEAQRSRRDASEARVLQARFEALHACKLLSDDELYILENLLVDNLEDCDRSRGEGESHSMVSSLVRLSEHAASDAGLARQLRRKYI